ncbi:MAG: hypothetical protein KDA92_26090 [Planctomycetales bacterium]|nr:hypothetical protein [Planctomycetales bacterium]MCA9172033.1 hypothetical protein [Planctomycetales bacterium]
MQKRKWRKKSPETANETSSEYDAYAIVSKPWWSATLAAILSCLVVDVFFRDRRMSAEHLGIVNIELTVCLVGLAFLCAITIVARPLTDSWRRAFVLQPPTTGRN